MLGHNPPLAGGLDRAWADGAHGPVAGTGGAVPAWPVVSYLPAVLWGTFIWDDLPMIGTLAVRGSGRAAADLVLSGRNRGGGPLLAAGLFGLLAAAQAVGLLARRVPRRQRAAAHGEHAAALAAHAAAGGARSVGSDRRVCRPSRARRVRGLGDRAQGPCSPGCSTCRRCWRGSASTASRGPGAT